MRKLTLFITVLALLLVIAILRAPAADAHASPIRAQICNVVWEQLPPGERFPAKRQCLAQVREHNCRHVPRFVPRAVTVKGRRADAGQRRVIGWLVTEALRRDLPHVVLLAAVSTTTQEASARELRHGHGSSLGPFQLIDSHGHASQRRTIAFSGDWFYNGAMKVYRRWRGIDAVTLSHRVQRSAHPTATRRWIPEARRTIKATLGGCTTGARWR